MSGFPEKAADLPGIRRGTSGEVRGTSREVWELPGKSKNLPEAQGSLVPPSVSKNLSPTFEKFLDVIRDFAQGFPAGIVLCTVRFTKRYRPEIHSFGVILGNQLPISVPKSLF